VIEGSDIQNTRRSGLPSKNYFALAAVTRSVSSICIHKITWISTTGVLVFIL